MVMPIVEVVWRHLLVGAAEGRRRYLSTRSLARELDLGISTVHRSLAHPLAIEAVITTRSGLSVTNPAKLLTLLAAHRHLERDILRRGGRTEPVAAVETAAQAAGGILGSFSAVARHLGANPIAQYTTVLVYLADPDRLPLADDLPEDNAGTQVLIAEPDSRLARYGTFTPLAQAYADLFSLPGWQAARFVADLDPTTIVADDRPVLLV